MPRHELTAEETKRGLEAAHAARRSGSRGSRRLQRDLAKMAMTKEGLGKLMDFLKVWAATAAGSIIITWLIIDGAQKTAWISPEEALVLKAIITGADFIGAVGAGLQQSASAVGAVVAALER